MDYRGRGRTFCLKDKFEMAEYPIDYLGIFDEKNYSRPATASQILIAFLAQYLIECHNLSHFAS